jgi:hypothetical protein
MPGDHNWSPNKDNSEFLGSKAITQLAVNFIV